jgi:cytochrome c-type biogenesis protein CcmH/NrfG
MNQDLKRIFEQGVAKYRSGNLLEAELLFRQALELDHSAWEIRFYLAMALERQQKHREAKNEFMSIRDWCPAPDLRQRAATAFLAIN